MSYENGNGGNGMMVKAQRIEIDKAAAATMEVGAAGLRANSMADVMEFAKMMAVADLGVPKHLRGNPGACLAVCMQAIEWRMSPFAVANKSYSVSDRIAYESQLIHAVIEQRAPLAGRLRAEYSGQGGQRRCKVIGYVRGDATPFVFESAPFDSIQPKNSPLWKTKPDLQLFYNASRDWARMYFPDLILGVYADDELDSHPMGSRAGTLDKAAKLNAAMGVKVSHPGDDGLTIDTSTSNEPLADEPVIDVGDGPDVSGADAEPPAATLPDVSTWEKFEAAVNEAAQDQNVPSSVTGQAVAKFKLGGAGAPKGKAAREAAIRDVLSGNFDWAAV